MKPVGVGMRFNSLQPMQLNEVMTTASFMKIKRKGEVHKNVQLKKGPADISQHTIELFNSPTNTNRRRISLDNNKLN